MQIQQLAANVGEFLEKLPQVKSWKLSGSLVGGHADALSDVDIEVELSQGNPRCFILQLPQYLAETFSVLYYDFAPSCAPEKYIVTLAIDPENPFSTIDIAVEGHRSHVHISREELQKCNNQYDHTLKLFTANLKHYLRGMDCGSDIEKMYGRILGETATKVSLMNMLQATFQWLRENQEPRHTKLLAALETYIHIKTESQ